MPDTGERTKDVARSISSVWGRSTSQGRALPTLLVAGAQRCGTTSLFQALRQHPAMLPPRFHKGLHYFDVEYGRGLDWYRGNFATRAGLKRLARKTGADPVQFEVTPYYMFHPAAPERIARDLPGVRVVVMLRDPVERAYSAHAHEFARGFDELSFAEALEAEDSRLKGETDRLRRDTGYISRAHRHQAYVARGRYVEQLRELADRLGRENVHVIDSDRFFADPAEAVAGVLDFVGLPPAPGMSFEVHNARPRPDLPAGTRDRLRQYFEPWDAQLADWLGWEPSWRQQS